MTTLRRLLRAVVGWLRGLFGGPAPTPTVEAELEPFGDPVRAEFYPVQTNPESSNGRLLFRRSSPEEMYIVPSRLLDATDIASVTVSDSAPGSASKRVEMTLTPAGRSKVQTLAASTSADNPVALVWSSEVFSTYPAYALDVTGPIVLADGLGADLATRLKAALT